MDNFESKYNFRYEEPNAATITSHARGVGEDETMRRKDTGRKLARERAQEKKQDLKKQRKDEIAKLKALKREEIIEKLKKADHLSKGNLFSDKLLVERVQKELETEFIPDVYDKTMTRMFNEKYYEDEADQDGHEIEGNKAIDMKLLQDQGDMVEPDAHEYRENEEKLIADFEEKVGKTMTEKAHNTAQNKLLDDGYDLWFCCDDCMEPIPEGMFRFDCTKCENFTFCLKCYKANTTHAHRFRKQKVPQGQGPPQNSDQLIAKAFMQCSACKVSLLELSKRVFICETCSEDHGQGDAVYWCKKCFESTEHEHKRTKFRQFQQASEDKKGSTNMAT